MAAVLEWTMVAPTARGVYEVRYGQHEDLTQMHVKVIGLSFDGWPICLLPERNEFGSVIQPPRFWDRVWVADPKYSVHGASWRGPL